MRVPCRAAPPTRASLRPAVVAAVVTALVVGPGVWLWCDGREAADHWFRARGHHTIEHDTTLWQAVGQLATRWLADAPAPRLELDIAFKNVQKLRAMQREALRLGRIDESAKSTVAGHVTHEGQRSKVKLRLKGDRLDHVSGSKVSFRVSVTDDHPVLGMRVFSLQAPESKGYHLEALFHATVRWAGLLSPRYEFVRVACNGDDLGVMALEEHCTKEMLEREGRRDSVVVRLAEDHMFAEQLRLGSIDPLRVPADDYRAAPVEVMGGGSARKQPAPVQAQATGLLRAFVSGSLAPADVFDVEALGAYLAVCELWGLWHPLRWHNLRFYFDPISGKLAPIGFDGNVQTRRPIGRLVTPQEPMIAAMLADPAVFAAFRSSLAGICAATSDGRLPAALAETQGRGLPILHCEYLLLQPFDLDELRARARHLEGVPDVAFRNAEGDPGLLPVMLTEHGSGNYEVRNIAPWPVVLHGLRWLRGDGTALAVEEPAGLDLPRTLAARPEEGPLPALAFVIRPTTATAGATLQVDAQVVDVGARHFVSAVPQPVTPRSPSLPAATPAELQASHPWLELDEDGVTWRAASGTHAIRDSLILPAGHRLALGPGTRLVFEASAALVVQGPLLCEGSEASPVELLPRGEGWPGMLVLARRSDVSVFRHAVVRSTTGVAAGAVVTSGGVVFQGGKVVCEDVVLRGTSAEDALNVVRAELEIRRLGIEGTRSDALDGDFVRGTVADSWFRDIGGDAVDVSGADLHVASCRMDEVRDKALSVGEGSRVAAIGLHGGSMGVGAACKDGSELTLEDSRFERPLHAGVMCYVKKPEFGAARAVLRGVTVSNAVPTARVQLGCRLLLDGKEVPGEAMDVDAMYASIMRK
ncbi:MAG: hypothetical protein R3F56_25120 [Planctomycetota bacterium]